jgi:hypothetical protein
MNLLAEQKLSLVDMQAVMRCTDLLMKRETEFLFDEAVNQLQRSGCNDGQLEILRNLKAHFLDHNIFSYVNTLHNEIKFFRKNCELLMPIKIRLLSPPGGKVNRKNHPGHPKVATCS